jgi:hypothetical protein
MPAADAGDAARAVRAARRREARAPFMLVAYRHGAVVLLGPPALGADEGEYRMPDIDAALLSRVMPLGAFYRSGRPEGSAQLGELGAG